MALPYRLEDERSTSRSPIRRTSRRSTSCASRRATSSRSGVAARDVIVVELERHGRVSEAVVERSRTSRRSRATTSSRRPRGGRRRHRGAGRPDRQLDHAPGGRGRGQRRPLRGAGGRPRRPLPDRRRPARGAADPAAARAGRDDPPEGAREAGHRRAAAAAGRPDLAARRLRRAGCSTSVSRPCRPSPARPSSCVCSTSRSRRRRSRRSASPTRCASTFAELDRPADGRDPRHGADRLGQVDDALRGAHPDQPARDQHHHGRGSGRVPARRRQPGADQRPRRADVRDARCARSCARTPTW